MKKILKYCILLGVAISLFFISGCVKQKNQDVKSQIEISATTSITNKWFETREAISLNKNTYQILKFKDEDVAYDIEAGNRYYSSKNNIAMTVEVYEDEGLSFEDVINKSMEYIEKNITKKEVVSEDENKIQYHIEYDIMNEYKEKEVVCLKTKTGYLLHDLTYFQAADEIEEAAIQSVVNEFLQAM